jgi:hypothetical protein
MKTTLLLCAFSAVTLATAGCASADNDAVSDSESAQVAGEKLEASPEVGSRIVINGLSDSKPIPGSARTSSLSVYVDGVALKSGQPSPARLKVTLGTSVPGSFFGTGGTSEVILDTRSTPDASATVRKLGNDFVVEGVVGAETLKLTLKGATQVSDQRRSYPLEVTGDIFAEYKFNASRKIYGYSDPVFVRTGALAARLSVAPSRRTGSKEISLRGFRILCQSFTCSFDTQYKVVAVEDGLPVVEAFVSNAQGAETLFYATQELSNVAGTGGSKATFNDPDSGATINCAKYTTNDHRCVVRVIVRD